MSRGAVMTHPAEELFRHRRSRPPVSVHPSPVHWALLPVSGPGSSPRLRTFRAAHFCHKGGYRALARTHTDEKEFDLSRGLFLFQRAAAHRIGDPFPAVAHPPSPLVPHSLGRPFNNSPPPKKSKPTMMLARGASAVARLRIRAGSGAGRILLPRRALGTSSFDEPSPGLFRADRFANADVGAASGAASGASADPDARLRADVRTMGSLLGSIIRERNGDGTFEQVEKLRSLAKVRIWWWWWWLQRRRLVGPPRTAEGGGGGGGGGDTCRAPSPPLKSKHRPIA